MKNAEISKILVDAGIKEHRLWNKPRPLWDDYDFRCLERIRNKSKHRARGDESFTLDRKVKRLSDGKMYDSVKIAAKDNKVGLSKIYDHCNGNLKVTQEFTYVYEKKI